MRLPRVGSPHSPLSTNDINRGGGMMNHYKSILLGILMLGVGFLMGMQYSPHAITTQTMSMSKPTEIQKEPPLSEFHFQQHEVKAESNCSKTPLNTAYMQAFRDAKQRVSQPKATYIRTPNTAVYKTCLYNFTELKGSFVDEYAQMHILEKRQIAEAFWLNQEGKLWMQHTRKGGGTTLCMTLRFNTHGLIKTSLRQWVMPERRTCQITDYCSDCDITKDASHRIFIGWHAMPRMMSCVMDTIGQNFIELEATVSPPDLLTNVEWANFVFVSTLRHPISRIVSSLRNDPQYNQARDGCPRPTNIYEITPCGHRKIVDADAIEKECDKAIYFCYSNYYTRMFAGHPTHHGHPKRPTPVTRDTLELAKRNFLRYSCVILQEQWSDTDSCLATRLGLHLKSDVEFNVAGKIKFKKTQRYDATQEEDPNADSVLLQSISHEELDRLKVVNALDLEFYEWAKDQILAGYFTGQ